MKHYCYLFEAKSIQAYLLATNRLKEIVGGSELVELLTGEGGLFDKALTAVGGEFEFSRKGGGAAFVFTTDKGARDRLAALWPLLVVKFAPDLEFVQARGEGQTPKAAYDAAMGRTAGDETGVVDLRADRQRLAVRLPQAGPMAVRNRRSGDVAVAYARSKPDAEPEPVDAVTERKLLERLRDGDALPKRFAEGSSKDQWPLNLDAKDADAGRPRVFPFLGDDRTVALVHADGNGLGQLLIDLADVADRQSERFIPIFKGFSQAVTRATQRAAQHATSAVLAPGDDAPGVLYPARPIVLGGDDLTMLVRADLALPFAERFIAAFAEETQTEFARLKREQGLDLPTRLTACAGIAYARASQPFYMLHNLAEQLCKHAKSKAKATLPPRTDWQHQSPSQRPVVPSALAFHRVTTALVDRYDTVLQDQLTLGALRQTLECYAIDPSPQLPSLGDLAALQKLLENPAMSRGAARELLGLIGSDRAQAPSRYKRWRELMRAGRQHHEHPVLLDRFQDLLGSLAEVERGGDLPYGPATEEIRRSPLGDVETLRSVHNRHDLMINAERQEFRQ
jgi:hypothetical protein